MKLRCVLFIASLSIGTFLPVFGEENERNLRWKIHDVNLKHKRRNKNAIEATMPKQNAGKTGLFDPDIKLDIERKAASIKREAPSGSKHRECDTGRDLEDAWPSTAGQLGATNYVSGTRTRDTWRYASTRNLPLTTRFTDSENICHEITLYRETDQITIAVPMRNELIFHGDERDRIGTDAQTRVAEITFRYTGSTWTNSHGIRLVSAGYTGDDYGYLDANAGDWDKALQLIDSGVTLVSALAEAGASAYTGGAA